MSKDISQTALFPAEQAAPVYYEQPLSERVRAFLRLEYLFALVHHSIDGDSEWSSRTSLAGLIEINDLLSRFDLRAELVKELDRNAQVMNGLRQNPAVDARRLDETLQVVTDLLSKLRSTQCQPAQTIRRDELVNTVKQRLPIPGGTCNFDVPAYHYWLSRPAATRRLHLHRWLQDLSIIHQGVNQALGMIRDSALPRNVRAVAGFYQQPVDPNVICQLVRVGVPAELGVFPEISGGKHRFTIRFLEQPDTAQRPNQSTANIDFDLQCCNL
jgi:cell division protein ZapD